MMSFIIKSRWLGAERRLENDCIGKKYEDRESKSDAELTSF